MQNKKRSKLAKAVNKMNVWLVKAGYKKNVNIELCVNEETGEEYFKVNANLSDGTQREFTGKTWPELAKSIYAACSDEPEAQEIADTMGALLGG